MSSHLRNNPSAELLMDERLVVEAAVTGVDVALLEAE